MLTREGEELKKIQLDLGLKSKDFANIMEIQPTYLSAIMHGKRKVPKNFINKMSEKLPLDKETLFRLRNLDKYKGNHF